MAKKNSKDFSSNPFKQLKGFAVSDDKLKKGTAQKKTAAKSKTEPVEEGPLDFLQEMEALGVEQTPDRPRTVVDEAPPVKKTPKAAARPKTDEEVFLNALGDMDVCFKDELPEDEQENLSKGSARRMKQLRQGKLVPEAQLDLHGLTRHQVADKIRFFLQDCLYQGYRTVLLVTGKGLHSQGEPVLRQEAERFLRLEGRTWVIEWARAPRQYGGEGALALFLRKKAG